MIPRTGERSHQTGLIIGCLLIGVPAAIAAVVLLGFSLSRMLSTRNLPPLKESGFWEMAPDFPRYPKASFDPSATNQSLLRILPSFIRRPLRESTYLVASFRCPDSRDRIVKWFGESLRRRGWAEGSTLSREVPEGVGTLLRYGGVGPEFRRGGEVCVFQFPPRYQGFVVHYVTNAPTRETLRRLERAVRENPSDGDAWVGLGIANLCLARWNEALTAATKALAVGPHSDQQRASLAHLLLWLEKFEDALPIVDQLSQNGRDRHWLRHQAECLEGVGAYEKALEVVNRLESPKGSDPSYRLWKAILLWAAGDRRKALSLLQGIESSVEAAPLLISHLEATTVAVKRGGLLSSPQKSGSQGQKEIPEGASVRSRWLTIYSAYTPSFVTGRFVAEANIDGRWAVSVTVTPDSPYRQVFKRALVYKMGGRDFSSPAEFLSHLRRVQQSHRPGTKIALDIWKEGRKERVWLSVLPVGSR